MSTAVEDALQQVLPTAVEEPRRLHEAMRYAVFSGGKRLRPQLCLAAARAVGVTSDAAIIPAVALELLHTYTLIHDDLPAMDDDDMRRGKPTVHVAFDEATAILAGDALLTLAFEVMAKTDNVRLVTELASASGSRGTVGGQEVDISAKKETITRAQLEYIHLNKTAKLFLASVRIGGLAAKADDAALTALTHFGTHLGLAYQLVDDFQDKDEKTLHVYSEQEIIGAAQRHFALATDALTPLTGDSSHLRDIAVQLLAHIPQDAKV